MEYVDSNRLIYFVSQVVKAVMRATMITIGAKNLSRHCKSCFKCVSICTEPFTCAPIISFSVSQARKGCESAHLLANNIASSPLLCCVLLNTGSCALYYNIVLMRFWLTYI